MAVYRKGQILKYSKKSEMEKELGKIRKTRKAYPSGKKGNWKIKVGAKKKTKTSKSKRRGRKKKRR